MKNIKLHIVIITIVTIIMMIIIPYTKVKAANYLDDEEPSDSMRSTSSNSTSSGGTSTTDGSWVKKAFQAASSFMKESAVDNFGFIESGLTTFSDIVRAINVVLLVALAGISSIALSVVGIKYIISADDPDGKRLARENLHTVIIGMAYGFGAFIIWKLAMGIVKLIISAFA